MRPLATISVFLSLSVSAQSAPITYACTLLDGELNPSMYRDVDQVVIDRATPYIELRVAKTMGTATEVNWIFTNRTGYDGSLEKMWMDRTEKGDMVASGLDAAGAYSFRYDGTHLLFGVTYLAPAMGFTWECTE